MANNSVNIPVKQPGSQFNSEELNNLVSALNHNANDTNVNMDTMGTQIGDHSLAIETVDRKADIINNAMTTELENHDARIEALEGAPDSVDGWKLIGSHNIGASGASANVIITWHDTEYDHFKIVMSDCVIMPQATGAHLLRFRDSRNLNMGTGRFNSTAITFGGTDGTEINTDTRGILIGPQAEDFVHLEACTITLHRDVSPSTLTRYVYEVTSSDTRSTAPTRTVTTCTGYVRMYETGHYLGGIAWGASGGNFTRGFISVYAS